MLPTISEIQAESAIPAPRALSAAKVAIQVGAFRMLIASTIVDGTLIEVNAFRCVITWRAAP